MSILKVYKYPHPVLREKCSPVASVTPEIQTFIQDMIETMYSFGGAVGLAAPQVGKTIRIVLIDTAAKTTQDNLKVLINPEIIQQSRNKLCREGCLSFPDYLANIKRATRLTVRCLNEYGETVEHQVRDLEAIAVQHELDHLEGILLVDRVQSLKTDMIRRQPALPEKRHSSSSSGEMVD